MKNAVARILRKFGTVMTAELHKEISAMQALLEYMSEQLDSSRPPLGEVANGPPSPHQDRHDIVAGLDYVPVSGGCIDPSPDPQRPLMSKVCTQSDFFRPSFPYWMGKIGEVPRFQRKMWEVWYVCQALYERQVLQPGRRGVAFGVGQEPLPSLFASLGCDILATDQTFEAAEQQGWAASSQHAANLQALFKSWLCDERTFAARVSWRELDMREIPGDLANSFDFCWSACAFEHLGSLQNGIDFVLASMDVLRPGGIAVHTTEFNLSSNKVTLETPETSIYRRCDLERLTDRLRAAGHAIEPFDWRTGAGLLDQYVDLPPYRCFPHLRLQFEQYTCTSVGLIVTKAQ